MTIPISAVPRDTNPRLATIIRKIAREAVGSNTTDKYGTPSTTEGVEKKLFFDPDAVNPRIYTYLKGERYYVTLTKG